MTTNFELVREFTKVMGQPMYSDPTWPGNDMTKLRLDLIDEEVAELKEAIVDNDMIGIADALADILYVVYGAGLTYGLNLDVIFREVHRSNMTKLDSDGNPIKNEAGKIVKGPNYESPKLEKFINPIIRTI